MAKRWSTYDYYAVDRYRFRIQEYDENEVRYRVMVHGHVGVQLSKNGWWCLWNRHYETPAGCRLAILHFLQTNIGYKPVRVNHVQRARASRAGKARSGDRFGKKPRKGSGVARKLALSKLRILEMKNA